MTDGTDLDLMTWEAADARREAGAVVFLPVGSTEQHGHHLPLGTDTMLATDIARAVATEVGGVVAPAVAYGFRSQQQSGGGEGFPGTTSLWGDTLATLVRDVVASLAVHGWRRIVVVNAHMENLWFLTDGIERAMTEHGDDGTRVLVCRWAMFLRRETISELFGATQLDWSLEHAGVVETSLMAALRPELVGEFADRDVAIPEPKPYETYPQPTAPSHSGSLSSPAQSDAEIGRRIVDDVVRGMSAAVRAEFGLPGA